MIPLAVGSAPRRTKMAPAMLGNMASSPPITEPGVKGFQTDPPTTRSRMWTSTIRARKNGNHECSGSDPAPTTEDAAAAAA
jgi:hypothetical protein